MLRQAEFYNLNASMQEQSKVGHCELSNEKFKEITVIHVRPEPDLIMAISALRTISSFDPIIADIAIASSPAYHLNAVFF